MIIPVSKKQVKSAKKKVKEKLKNARITLTDLAAHKDCPISYQTVKEAFNADIPYWNQDVVNLAFEMIKEKKKEIKEQKKLALSTK